MAQLTATALPEPPPVGVIDLGTNTFHLLVVDFHDRETYTVREKHKETVKLGEGGITSGMIAEGAFQRGVEALVRFRQILDRLGVRQVLAYGTSALRGAHNAGAFLEQARTQARIDVKVINGNEEALLIYQGVRAGVRLPLDEDVLMVDIGGGSVEFIVGNAHQAKLLRSLKLGAARMLEYINPADPITPRQISQLKKFYAQQLQGLQEEIADFSCLRMLGSSGTFETLGALVAYDKGDTVSAQKVNGYRFDRRSFRRIHQVLMQTPRAERLRMPGMDPTRVDMIMVGSVLVDYLLEKTKLDEVQVSEYALKEGILQSYLESGRDRQHDRGERSMRERAVRDLAKRFNYDAAHTRQVQKLAYVLFDALTDYHGYGPEERELLGYACLLHDIGHYIHHSGHHKHSQYIVMNSALQGFSGDELLLLGNLVRYHRKSLPTREHVHYNVLYREHKDVVRRLAGILRIADNLDRGRNGLVDHITVELNSPTGVRVKAHSQHRLDVQLDYALQECALFEEAFNMALHLEQVLLPEAVAAPERQE